MAKVTDMPDDAEFLQRERAILEAAQDREWVIVRWETFCTWVQGKRVAETRSDNCSVTMVFDDESEATMLSHYEEDWSEVTPGAGIRPPSVSVRRKRG